MPLKSEQVNRNVRRNYSRRTFEFLIYRAASCNAQTTDELFKVDGAVLVFVEDVKQMVDKLVRVTTWEELFIHQIESLLVELTRGTVLAEAFVPVPQCSRVEGEGSVKIGLPLLKLV
jgi:hypothetical protein